MVKVKAIQVKPAILNAKMSQSPEKKKDYELKKKLNEKYNKPSIDKKTDATKHGTGIIQVKK